MVSFSTMGGIAAFVEALMASPSFQLPISIRGVRANKSPHAGATKRRPGDAPITLSELDAAAYDGACHVVQPEVAKLLAAWYRGAERRAAFSAVIERHAMAHRRPALRFQAHAFARDGLWKFGQNTRCAWKTARAGTARAADLLNRPAQRRLNRTGLCIDILPV